MISGLDGEHRAQRRLRFENIDVVRGFAAISVVFLHIIAHFDWTEFPRTMPLRWFRMGWMGVDIFFVISGFVITLAVLQTYESRSYRDFFVNFANRRLARIVPLYYFTMLIWIAFVQPGIIFNDGLRHIGLHLGFLQTFDLDVRGSINGVNWTVATEMQFYLLMALLAPVLRSRFAWSVPALMIPISYAWRYFAVTHLAAHDAEDRIVFHFSSQLPGTLDEFAFGIAGALLVRSNYSKHLQNNFVVLALFASTAVLFSLTLGKLTSTADYWHTPMMVTFFKSLIGASALCLVLFFCYAKFGHGNVLLAPFRYLGVISYGIYLRHLPVIMTMKTLTWLKPAASVVPVLTLTIILASVSWHFFERPILETVRSKNPIGAKAA